MRIIFGLEKLWQPFRSVLFLQYKLDYVGWTYEKAFIFIYVSESETVPLCKEERFQSKLKLKDRVQSFTQSNPTDQAV